MKITYNVKAPEKNVFRGEKSEEVRAIEDFLTSGSAKNMCFEYDTEAEAKSKSSTIASHRRKYNEKNPKGYESYRVGKCIYVIKAANSSRGKSHD